MTTTTLPSARPEGIAPPWTYTGHENPYAWMAFMTTERPIAIDEQTGIVHFTGYQAVHDFLRDAEIWSTAKRMEMLPPEVRFVRLLTSDPPVHAVLRGFFSRSYRPRRIAGMEPRIREVARSLAATAVEKGTFDLTAEFAAPLTATMICGLIGIPPEDQDSFFHSTRSVGSALGPLEEETTEDSVKGAAGMRSTATADGSNMASLDRYFRELIDARRKDPRDDLVTELAKMPEEEIDGKVDLGALLNEQVGAGQSTTTHLLGSALYLLTEHPDQMALLVEDPSRIPGAVEETVRLSSPLSARPRIATRDIEIDGVPVAEGTTGMCWNQAANLDPDHFKEPLRYDVQRNPNPHLSFGFGEHFCLGATLARLEVRVALEELLGAANLTRLDPGPPTWVEDFVLRGPAALPLVATAR